MKYIKFSDDDIVDISTIISLRLDTNRAILEMIDKIMHKVSIELECATSSNAYLEKLVPILLKINDFKTLKITKRNQKLMQAKDIDMAKDIKKDFLDKSSITMKKCITDRIQSVLALDELLSDCGDSVEVSKYILHIAENLKNCVKSEIALDNFYKNYLKKFYKIDISLGENTDDIKEVDNEK